MSDDIRPKMFITDCEQSAWRLIARADRTLAEHGMHAQKRKLFIHRAGIRAAAKYPADETPRHVWFKAYLEVIKLIDIVR